MTQTNKQRALILFRNWILREYHTAVSQLSYSHFSSLCCQANCVHGKLFSPHMLHEQASAYGSSDWRCHQSLQVSSVESTPSVCAREILARFFFHMRGVFVGVSKVKRVATMPSIINTPHHQRDARIFSQCKVYLTKL